MRLRFRHPNGIGTLDVNPNDTLATLKAAISEQIALPPGKAIQLSVGYPPKPHNDDTATIVDSGIGNGDLVIVNISNAAVSSPPSSQTQTSQTRLKANDNTGNNMPSELSSAFTKASAESVELDGGYLVLREMKDDNSCLFRSVGYALNRDIDRSQELREVVAASILSDPITYSDAILGRPVDQYVNWILKPNSWGGAIELAIFSKHFEIEIDSFDVANGRTDKFGEGQYAERVLLMYTGIHYDVLALTPAMEASGEFDQTRFSTENSQLLQAGSQLANSLKKQRKYTDTSNFTLKCNDCGKGLIGERDATSHASQTGHTHFVEYL